jgi:predicted secreted protein
MFSHTVGKVTYLRKVCLQRGDVRRVQIALVQQHLAMSQGEVLTRVLG